MPTMKDGHISIPEWVSTKSLHERLYMNVPETVAVRIN